MPKVKERAITAISRVDLFDSAREKIIEDVLKGLPLSRAATKNGINAVAVSERCNENSERFDPVFASQIARAEADFMADLVDEVRNGTDPKGGPDWRARAWVLERRFPQQFAAKPDVAVQVNNTVSITLSEPQRVELAERYRKALEIV